MIDNGPITAIDHLDLFEDTFHDLLARVQLLLHIANLTFQYLIHCSYTTTFVSQLLFLSIMSLLKFG